MRTIGSTLVGEFFDTFVMIMIAFYGVMDMHTLLVIIISNYIFKVWVEVVLTPVTYQVVAYLKKKEETDVYDVDTNFNPFVVS